MTHLKKVADNSSVGKEMRGSFLRGNGLALAFIGLLSGLMACTSVPKESEDRATITSIPLQVFASSNGSHLANIEVSVDGHKRTFLLDTGAATSSIANDDHTSKYPSLGPSSSTGASGKSLACEIVQPKALEIGALKVGNPKLKRCDRNILGLDILSNFVFRVNFEDHSLDVLTSLPLNSDPISIRRLSPGHATIPLKVESQTIDVLLDTGADTTVFDSQFIASHPKLFQMIRTESGFDAHGNKISSKVYRVGSIEIGSLKLKDVEVAAFDFGDHLREKMEGSPAILGNNVISKAKWNFDLKTNVLTMESIASDK